MSFALTEPQLLDGSKDVTRRLGWRELKPDDQVLAVRKAMGLRKGERQVVLGTVRVLTVIRERLDEITEGEVEREGFPGQSPAWFVDKFCRANGCTPETEVTRIAFHFTRAPSPEPQEPAT